MEPETQDTFARVLAAAGLATALFAAAISLLTYLRDRHKLVVRGVKGHDANEGTTSYAVTIANHGRQPVSVTSAGIRYQHPEIGPTRLDRLLRRSERKYAGGIYVSFFADAFLLAPGEIQTFEMDHWILAQTLLGDVSEGECSQKTREGAW